MSKFLSFFLSVLQLAGGLSSLTQGLNADHDSENPEP